MGDNTRALKPLAGTDGDPVFDELWQAQALAMADSLVQGGLFAANDWSEALGRKLKEAGAKGDADTQETYYACVLSALENLIDSHSEIDQNSMAEKRRDWEEAYRSTPHGKPVRLNH